jgi:hypothetical protein
VPIDPATAYAETWRDDEARFHREDGPAVVRANGTTEWWRHGNMHRVGGPALEIADGGAQWWVNGQAHREDGPAYETSDGRQLYSWHGTYVHDPQGLLPQLDLDVLPQVLQVAAEGDGGTVDLVGVIAAVHAARLESGR